MNPSTPNKDLSASLIQRLKNKAWASTQERDQLIQQCFTGPHAIHNPRDLIDLLFVEEGAIQRAVLKRIQYTQSSEAVELFLLQSTKRPASMVQGLSKALVMNPPTGTGAVLIRMLDHTNTIIQRTAQEMLLGNTVNNDLIAQAASWLLNENNLDRAGALIANLDQSAKSLGQTPDGLVALAQHLTNHANDDLRLLAYRILVRTRNTGYLPLFIEALGRETKDNQSFIAEAISRNITNVPPDNHQLLFLLLASPHKHLRSQALSVLQKTQDFPTTLRAFFAYSRTLAPWLRDRSLETLAGLGEQLRTPLISMLSDPDRDIRMIAMSLAHSIGADKRMIPPLVTMLSDRDWWVQSSAADMLAQVGGPSVITPLRKLIADPNSAWIAVDALASLGRSLGEAGDGRNAARALEPLALILKAGQQPLPNQQLEDQDSIDIRTEIVNALRSFRASRIMDMLRQVAIGDRNQSVRTEALSAARAIARTNKLPLPQDQAIAEAANRVDTPTQRVLPIQQLLIRARQAGASDLHIGVDLPPMIRVCGHLQPLDINIPALPASQTALLLRALLSEDQAHEVARFGGCELCHTIPGQGRARASIFVDHKGVNAAFRIIERDLPTLDSIGLPERFNETQYWHQGIVIACGPSGCGKTTTLAALVNLINETRQRHILTIEDPIEFIHPSRRSLVNQRDAATHTSSFARSLRGALRADPDVIVIGELRDEETTRLALEAAETGHLVLTTLNCTRAEAAIDRIIGSFPADEQSQARNALADSMKAIVAQNLLPHKDGTSMVPVFEVIMGLPTVANVIRDGKAHMMATLMQTGRNQGMQTFDDNLVELVQNNTITAEVALKHAQNRPVMAQTLRPNPSATATQGNRRNR